MNIVAIKRRRLLRNFRAAIQALSDNAFCPTGEGGGQDNSCAPSGDWKPEDIKRLSSDDEEEEEYIRYVLPTGGNLVVDYNSVKKNIDIQWLGASGTNLDVSKDSPQAGKVGLKNLHAITKRLLEDFPKATTISGWRTGGLKTGTRERVSYSISKIIHNSDWGVLNAFCPTGEGGGKDNSCSPTGGGGSGEAPKFNRDADHHAVAPGWANPPGNWRQRAYGGVMFKFIGDEPAFLLREPANHFDGYHWTFPKGKLNEEHENPLHAAAREVLEETGRESKVLGYVPGTHGVNYPDYHDPKTGLTHPGYKSSNYFFLMKSKGKVQEPDKETWKTKWATESEAKKLIAQSTNKQGRERDLGILKAAVQAVKDGGHKSTYVEPPKDKPTKNEAELVENPFVSEAQRRACYAKDDPAWDCHEWSHATPKDKKLPERKPGAVHNLRRATKPNPLRYDPTQTATIRRMFEGLIRSKFSALKRRVIKLIVEEDALGLVRSTPFTFNAFCPTGEGGGVDPSCSGGLYHGTPGKNLQSILKHGLKAGKAGHIFAADSEMEALDYAIMQAEDHKDTSIALLRVDPKGFREFETPVGDVYLAHPDAHLPPDRIKSHTLMDLKDARARRDKLLDEAFPTHNATHRFIAVVIPHGATANAYCPTGPGGGQDNSCSPTGGQGRSDELKLPPKPKFISSDKKNVAKNEKAVKQMEALAKKGDLEGLKEHEGTPSPKVQAYQQQLIKAVEAHQSKSGKETDEDGPKPTPKEVPAPAVKQVESKVPDPKNLEFVKDLSGSTHPKLMADSDGKQWVVKESTSEAHLRNEVQADATYRAMGVAVPNSGMAEGKNGPAKVSEFLEGKTLAAWDKGKKPAEIEAMHDKIGQHMAADALIANWDAVGLSRDNILISPKGEPIRIDNGGSLLYRAQGAPKGDKFGTKVNELDLLRDPKVNAAAANVYKNITDANLKGQIGELSGKRDAILGSIQDKGLRDKIGARLDSMEKWAEDKPGESGKSPPKPPPAPAPMPAVSQVTKSPTSVGKGPKIAEVSAQVQKLTGMNEAQLKHAVTGDVSPNHPERAIERMKVTDAIYKNNLAVPNAINHVLDAHDKAAGEARVKAITSGDVGRATKEYAQTPLHDLNVLSKVSVSDKPVSGQAVCNMASRSLTMGSTSVTGDFRHELGHAIRSSWGGSSYTGKTAMTEAVGAEYKSVMTKIGGPEGAKEVKKLKLSHEAYETKYGVVGKRGPDNWEENAAEHYRLYHREVYRDRNEGGNGKFLAQYRERHPGWAKIWDAHYTTAMLGQ